MRKRKSLSAALFNHDEIGKGYAAAHYRLPLDDGVSATSEKRFCGNGGVYGNILAAYAAFQLIRYSGSHAASEEILAYVKAVEIARFVHIAEARNHAVYFRHHGFGLYKIGVPLLYVRARSPCLDLSLVVIGGVYRAHRVAGKPQESFTVRRAIRSQFNFTIVFFHVFRRVKRTNRFIKSVNGDFTSFLLKNLGNCNKENLTHGGLFDGNLRRKRAKKVF